MFRSRHFAQTRRIFAGQFEPEGDGFVYRRNQHEAPVRVTAAERDAFVATFERALRRAYWLFVGTIVASCIALSALSASLSQPLAESWFWAVFLLPTGGCGWLVYRAWNAPRRQLSGRLSAGLPRSWEEMRQRPFMQLTWGGLASAAGLIVAAVFAASRETDVMNGWGRLWLVGAGAALALLGLEAIRKARSDAAARRGSGGR